LKPTIDRTRPNGGHQSFPSGHAASAFAGAAFLQRRYGWRIGVPAGLLASFAAWSRVESREPYTSDALAGPAARTPADPRVPAPPAPRRAGFRPAPPPRRPALHVRVVPTPGRPRRSLAALLIPALAVLAAPAEASSPEPLVVVRALDEAGRSLPGIEVE